MNWKAFGTTVLTTVITAAITAILQYFGAHPAVTAVTAGTAAGMAHAAQSPFNG